ncbi:MAG: hypothetical protein AAF135_13155, partial [Bacteroidota bacterium]
NEDLFEYSYIMDYKINKCAYVKAFSDNRNPRKLYLSDSVPEIDKTRETKILTAFFGLDNALPQRARLIYAKAPGKDGMPLVFSHELDPSTLDGADFAVTTQDGSVFNVEAASFLPANEEFELRTVLLIGEYGTYPDNQPVSVKIVGDLVARAGQNYKGDSIKVIPLESGPILSYAEYFTIDEDYPYRESGDACDCPKEETYRVVKAVWAGGVRALNGEELGENEKNAFTVTLVDGVDTLKVHPFQLADLGDNENNIDLCLKETGIPILVEVAENVAMDPNDDPNPKTQIKVVSRW